MNKNMVRVSNSNITELNDNEIFVFGSNKNGLHMDGAAAVAHEKFGAEWGIGEGLTGKTYAIPTMEGIENIKPAVQRFIEFAKTHQELVFLVTLIGCGIAGYTEGEIAPLFKDCLNLENVYLPAGFINKIL